MDVTWILFLSPFLVIAGFIGWQVVLERMCDKAVSRVSEDELSKIVEELDAVGTDKSKSFFLKPKSTKAIQGRFCITLPPQMDIQWLKGESLLVSLNPDGCSDDDLGEVLLVTTEAERSDFDLVPIPRIKFKTGGGANQYTPKVWFKRNPGMLSLAQKMYPRDPSGFLSALLDRHGRVNSPFEWLQSPPRLLCKSCSRKLRPVFQVNGSSVGLNGEAVYYVAACPQKQGEFQVFLQFS